MATGNNILARARTIATQIGGDANLSPVIDNLAGLRALLNNVIRDVYRAKAGDQKFLRDITSRSTVTISSGTGTVPDEWMKEFMHLSDITDSNNSQVTYYNYAADYNSGVNYNQLGYCYILGDEIKYTAPSPDFATYSGNLYVTVPQFPVFPASMAQEIPFPSEATADDVVRALAQAIRGGE